MNVERMREELMKLYGKNWQKKVKSMPDHQIIAIYKSMQKRGKIK